MKRVDIMYNLIFADSFDIDLKSIVNYIAADSPKNARNFETGVIKKIENLSDMPLMGYRTKIKKYRAIGFRNLVIGKYLTYYRVDELKKEVEVIRIVHGSRKQERLIFPNGEIM